MGDESTLAPAGPSQSVESPSVSSTPPEPSSPKPKFDYKTFFKDKWWILLILIPIIVAIVIRLEPMNLRPIERSAQSNVESYYRYQIENQVRQQNPNLPDAQIAQLVNQQIPKEQIAAQAKQNAAEMKGRLQYDSGDSTYAYIGDIDSYYWLRQARNIVEKGDQCDLRKDGQCFDTYTTAPVPRPKEIDYYPVAIVWVYRFLKVFQPDLTLMQASFLTPLVFSIILTIPLFLLIRKLAGNVAAVIGTILVNANPLILSRSLGSDSDITNIFFQAFFLWLAVECLYAKDAKKRWIWAALVGVELSLYSLFWTGWWYLLDLFIAALGFRLAYDLVKKWLSQKSLAGWQSPAKDFGILVLAVFVPVVILHGFVFFSLAVFTYGLHWYLLNRASVPFIFLLVLPLLAALPAHLRSDEEFHAGAVFLMVGIITLVTFFSLRGIRFLFLMAVPVAIFASIALARAAGFVTGFLDRKGIPKIATLLLTILLVVWFVGAQVKSGYATAGNYLPLVTDEWVGTLQGIRDQSKPDAVINSWWDFGHWFKYWADRRVTLDGSSQNSPQLHWLGKLLLTSDERLSVGILRMLDCGGNNAFNELNRKFNDVPKSVALLNQMMVVNRLEAEAMLTK